MEVLHDHKADRIVVHQPGHLVGWPILAAGALAVPAGLWALPIATSGHVAIAIGAILLAAVFLWLGAMALTAITATFDGGTRSLTIRRERPWRGTEQSVPFADVLNASESRHWGLEATEYRFEIALADERKVRMRYKADEEAMVQDAAVAINRFIRR